MPSIKIVFQSVHTYWTKASRGGIGARRRNELPRSLPLPLECFTAKCAIHRVGFSEFNDFHCIESITKGRAFSDLNIRDLVLIMDGDSLVIELRHDPNNAAIANRIYPVQNIPAFSLNADEWGQLLYNGRYVVDDTGDWWYEQNIYNIGLFSKVTVDRFVATKPTKRFAEMASLH
jgi:hypothetical protein